MNREKNESDLIKEQLVTYDMYMKMPDDGVRYEIMDGRLEMMSPAPSTIHQTVSRELEFLLMQSCKSDYLIFYAPVDLILSETNVLQPDILMIHRSRLQIVTKRGIEGVPDLVVEIISPGSRSKDKVLKMKTYAKYDVPEYWIVDAESQTLEQYRLMGAEKLYVLYNLFEGNDTVTSDKLPCVSFTVSTIFSEIQNLELFKP